MLISEMLRGVGQNRVTFTQGLAYIGVSAMAVNLYDKEKNLMFA